MRALVYNPENAELWEVFNEPELLLLIDQNKCVDVTGVENYERIFKEESNK
jgi:hypothetical protein